MKGWGELMFWDFFPLDCAVRGVSGAIRRWCSVCKWWEGSLVVEQPARDSVAEQHIGK